jgi:hypothetical protein
MTTAAQALAKAKSVKTWAVGMCDNFVANMYGFSSSGYATAVKNWQATPANLKHGGDWNAPAGALMYWSGGSTGAGHVAISLGNGNVISTDATSAGVVGTISARTPTDKWGHPYLGWAYPYFQGKEATSTLGGWNGSTSAVPASTTGTQISADSITTGFLSSALAPINFLFKFTIWGIEASAGIVLMLLGLWIFTKEEGAS